MIGEINVNSHIWKILRTTVQGQILLQLLFVGSADYWTHASTVGIRPAESHRAMLTLGTGKRLCWAEVRRESCKFLFQLHGGLHIYKRNTLSLTAILTKRRDPLSSSRCCAKAELNDCRLSEIKLYRLAR